MQQKSLTVPQLGKGNPVIWGKIVSFITILCPLDQWGQEDTVHCQYNQQCLTEFFKILSVQYGLAEHLKKFGHLPNINW